MSAENPPVQIKLCVLLILSKSKATSREVRRVLIEKGLLIYDNSYYRVERLLLKEGFIEYEGLGLMVKDRDKEKPSRIIKTTQNGREYLRKQLTMIQNLYDFRFGEIRLV